ncbi:MAG: putative manganese transporter [Coriobacteriia bacterium]|nr:putative manganese transporter [Coriobacteriia bacterium]
MELLVDVLADSVIDTLKLIPFLFVTYLAMEALEHAASHKIQETVERAGALGPVAGSVLGALPQCGFSAMAATLFSGRVVTMGTLVAVILSTSDEMIPVFVAHQANAGRMFAIIGIKVACGLVAGLALDAALHLLHREGDGHAHIHELCEREHCHCEDLDEEESEEEGLDGEKHEDARGAAHKHGHDHAHGHHGHAHHHGAWGIVRSALVHTVQVTAFIFLITLVFGLVIEGVGEDTIGALLADHPVRATFLAAIVGLIPNCGASVAITELFLDGTLASGPMIAGLLSSGGVGLLVLWRTNSDLRQNAVVTVLVYGLSVLAGLAVCALGILL